MLRKTTTAAFLLSSLCSTLSHAQDVEKKAGEVYLNQGDLVLEEDGKITKFITPSALSEHGRFQVRIVRPKAALPPEKAPEAPVEPANLSQRIEARRILNDANAAFFKGDVTRAWDLVVQAENLDPTSYLIKTMKGSLLYKIGSTDLAVEVWNESLAQNPDQPEIRQLLTTLLNQAKAPAGIATGLPVEPAKKVSRQ
jgi:hypothetical protein